MRKLFLLAILLLTCLLTINANAANRYVIDSITKITHVIDGNMNEWIVDKFETDLQTKVLYAIEHDDLNLYAAMKISDMGIQMKMMRQGMKMFIDKKGKKKESVGIEFPIKRAGGGGFGGEQGPPDPQSIRQNMANWMIFLKTFGFNDLEDKSQLITLQDGINIAFDWDEANTLFIEYKVPFNYLGGKAALAGKTVSIGWKILGDEDRLVSSAAGANKVSVPGSGSSAVGGRSAGGGGGSSPADAFSSDLSTGSGPGGIRSKEQSFWIKYTPIF